MKILHFEKIKSTQDYLKKLKNPKEDVAVIAGEQTVGKGTKGRSFSSEKGGVYLSLLKLFPCKAKDSFSIMQSSAVAVCKTLASFGIKAQIKWPNDIFVGEKKICGILIENMLSGEYVSSSVIGIGLNVNNSLPPFLSDTAISAKEVLGEELPIDSVIATLLYNLYQPTTEYEYKSLSMVLGREITVLRGDGTSLKAVAKDVLPNGNLLLFSGEELSAAEISIK